ncbi:hypothetical protein [Faecalicoccus acidiformans]|uniref:Uncharacterized protein n=1 Tax=Faecalicoccus acidiformans TaxID=915173 RepID=A0ABS2FPG8_9FIRM|nr:hypothetical protein [Faecalicoccus acidiformans]MBM6831679.1 hypothetical protein [Faecalicoccus acidiformans]
MKSKFEQLQEWNKDGHLDFLYYVELTDYSEKAMKRRPVIMFQTNDRQAVFDYFEQIQKEYKGKPVVIGVYELDYIVDDLISYKTIQQFDTRKSNFSKV